MREHLELKRRSCMDSEQQRLLPAALVRSNSAARQQATVPCDTSAASGRVARRRLRTEIIGRRTKRAGRAFSIFFLLPLHKQGRPPHFLLEHLLVAMASPWRQPAVRACVCAAEPCDTYKTGTHKHTHSLLPAHFPPRQSHCLALQQHHIPPWPPSAAPPSMSGTQ